MSDERPEIEPRFYSFSELPADPSDVRGLFVKMAEDQRESGATFFRFTIISPEYPTPPYPDGLYVEGFTPPEGPWKQAPFNYPLEARADDAS